MDQCILSMGAVVAAGFVTPPAIMGLHLFLLVECQHFRTEQRSDTFHVCFNVISWASALRVLEWWWIRDMWSARWIRKCTTLSSRMPVVGPELGGILESPVRLPEALWIHLLLSLSVGQWEPPGEVTTSYSRSLVMPWSCWVGFPAAGYTWPGLGFCLF